MSCIESDKFKKVKFELFATLLKNELLNVYLDSKLVYSKRNIINDIPFRQYHDTIRLSCIKDNFELRILTSIDSKYFIDTTFKLSVLSIKSGQISFSYPFPKRYRLNPIKDPPPIYFHITNYEADSIIREVQIFLDDAKNIIPKY